MRKLVVVGAFALACTPLAYGGLFGGLSASKKRRHIERQKVMNQRYQDLATASFNVDAIPDYNASLRELEQLTDMRSQTGAFSQFQSTSSQIPAHRLLEQLSGQGNMLSERRGHHTSTSLPFLDTTSQDDLAFKLEAVKICEAALKELKQSPDNAAGGFQMMKFLSKLVGKVSQRQKGMVNSMLTLITTPYFATLASSWWMGPTTAMDITQPGAKRGISSMIEQVLKRYGRIGQGMNIQSYASQLTGGGAGLDLGQLNSTLGQANQSLGKVGLSLGDAGMSSGQLVGKMGSQFAGQLGQQVQLGSKLGLGTLKVGPLEVDLAKQLDKQVVRQFQKQGNTLGTKIGDELPDVGNTQLSRSLGKVNSSLGRVGLSLGDGGKTPEQMVNEVGSHLGGQAAKKLVEPLNLGDRLGSLEAGPLDLGKVVNDELVQRVEKQGSMLGSKAAGRLVRK